MHSFPLVLLFTSYQCCTQPLIFIRAVVSQLQLDQSMSGRRMINIYKMGESILR